MGRPFEALDTFAQSLMNGAISVAESVVVAVSKHEENGVGPSEAPASSLDDVLSGESTMLRFRVVSDTVIARSAPSISAKKLSKHLRGDILRVAAENSNWVLLRDGGGWLPVRSSDGTLCLRRLSSEEDVTTESSSSVELVDTKRMHVFSLLSVLLCGMSALNRATLRVVTPRFLPLLIRMGSTLSFCGSILEDASNVSHKKSTQLRRFAHLARQVSKWSSAVVGQVSAVLAEGPAPSESEEVFAVWLDSATFAGGLKRQERNFKMWSRRFSKSLLTIGDCKFGIHSNCRVALRNFDAPGLGSRFPPLSKRRTAAPGSPTRSILRSPIFSPNRSPVRDWAGASTRKAPTSPHALRSAHSFGDLYERTRMIAAQNLALDYPLCVVGARIMVRNTECFWSLGSIVSYDEATKQYGVNCRVENEDVLQQYEVMPLFFILSFATRIASRDESDRSETKRNVSADDTNVSSSNERGGETKLVGNVRGNSIHGVISERATDTEVDATHEVETLTARGRSSSFSSTTSAGDGTNRSHTTIVDELSIEGEKCEENNAASKATGEKESRGVEHLTVDTGSPALSFSGAMSPVTTSDVFGKLRRDALGLSGDTSTSRRPRTTSAGDRDSMSSTTSPNDLRLMAKDELIRTCAEIAAKHPECAGFVYYTHENSEESSRGFCVFKSWREIDNERSSPEYLGVSKAIPSASPRPLLRRQRSDRGYLRGDVVLKTMVNVDPDSLCFSKSEESSPIEFLSASRSLDSDSIPLQWIWSFVHNEIVSSSRTTEEILVWKTLRRAFAIGKLSTRIRKSLQRTCEGSKRDRVLRWLRVLAASFGALVHNSGMTGVVDRWTQRSESDNCVDDDKFVAVCRAFRAVVRSLHKVEHRWKQIFLEGKDATPDSDEGGPNDTIPHTNASPATTTHSLRAVIERNWPSTFFDVLDQTIHRAAFVGLYRLPAAPV